MFDIIVGIVYNKGVRKRGYKMNIPQIIVIVIMGLSIGVNLGKHGEKQNDTYNVWHSLFRVAIWIGLLVWGGFF